MLKNWVFINVLFPGEKCSVKLTVDSEANRVVFVEGGKDFFWFLMSLPQLSIATFINQIQINRVGSIGNIYKSVKNLNEAYIKFNQTKEELLISSESKSWSQALELFQGSFLVFYLLFQLVCLILISYGL